MATIKTTTTIPDALLPLVEHSAAQEGKTLESYVSERQSSGFGVQQITNDRAFQALSRLLQRGEVPAEIVAESAAVLPKASA